MQSGVTRFRASSLNVADVRVYRKGMQMAVDVSWDRPPSAKDIEQCDRWFSTLPGIAAVKSVVLEDADDRERAIRQHLVAGEN